MYIDVQVVYVLCSPDGDHELVLKGLSGIGDRPANIVTVGDMSICRVILHLLLILYFQMKLIVA